MAKIGRPTKYDPKYCDEIVKFFDRETYVIKTVVTKKNGFRREEPKIFPLEFPTSEAFANKIGVDTDTLLNWAKNHEEFSDAYTRAKQLQYHGLIQAGLAGAYPSNAFIFVAKNYIRMKDKIEVDVKEIPICLDPDEETRPDVLDNVNVSTDSISLGATHDSF
jgi:hypothetical protein